MNASSFLARATGVDLAEHDLLELVVQGEHTSASNTTENVGTSTLEERANTLLSDDLRASVEHGLVVSGGTGSHHHAATGSGVRTM
jgi:hypothetical protein